MSTRLACFLALLGIALSSCKDDSTAQVAPQPAAPPPAKADEPEPQGLPGFFAPRLGETWTYDFHRDVPPDSVLNDDDQLRSVDLPGGGYRFTSVRNRVCLGTQTPEGSDTPLTVLELSDDGISTGLEYLDIGPDGMIARAWQPAGAISSKLQLLDPGIRLAAPGMTGGQSWTSTGTSPKQTYQFRVIERSKVTVPAGTWEAVKLQMNSGSASRATRRTLWFAENVGIIKEETIQFNDRRIITKHTSVLTAWTVPEESLPVEPVTEEPVEPEEAPTEEPENEDPATPESKDELPIIDPIAFEESALSGEEAWEYTRMMQFQAASQFFNRQGEE